MKNKTIVKTYYPQSVDLPPGIERGILLADDVKLVEHYKGLSKKDRQPIDTKTLFYDMFFISNHLICIGPPFYGFGNPLAIKCERKKLKFKIYHRHNVRAPSVVLIRMGRPRSCNLEFIFQEFSIKVSYIHQPLPSAKTMLTMITLQKNNFLIWIKDWCSYHTRAYEVERIFLYDNGSEYWIDLAESLAELDENLEIILINWPYKYGYPLSDSDIYWYEYCQPAALQHYRLAFGGQTKWCINLDIDEYLYLNSSAVPLKTYLATKTRIRPMIPIKHYNFPMGQTEVNQQTRFYHLQYRYKLDYYSSIEGLKYICQPTKILTMEVHGIEPYTSKLLLKTILFNWEKLPYLTVLLYRAWVYLVNFSFSLSKRREKRCIFNTNQIKGNPLYFFHFRDLYSDWFKGYRRLGSTLPKFRNINTIPSEQLISDRRVINKAIEVGIIKQSDIPSS